MNELQGNTQVAVSFGTSGVGVFAVDLPNVPLRLRWADDSHLVVGYPEQLTPTKKEGRIQNDQEVVTITYEPFNGDGARVAALEKAYGRSTLAERRKQLPPKKSGDIVVNGRKLRGEIIRVSDGDFRFDYDDVREPDSSSEKLRSMGHQGGGPSWAGIVYGLVMLKQPALMTKLRFDEEGDGLAIWSADKTTLVTIAELVTDAKDDPELLKRAIAKASADGEME